jgi:hypothetical protein
MSELRQRSTKKEEEEEAKSSPSLSPAARARAEDNAITLLDLCRGLVFLLLLCGATSYIVTRESFIWNIKRPGWTRPAAIRAWIVCAVLSYNLSLPAGSSLPSCLFCFIS